MSGALTAFPATTSNESSRRRLKTRGLRDWRVSAYSLIAVSVLLIVFSSLLHADDLTGLSNDDPKDLMPAPHQTARCTATGDLTFQPLPPWARGTILSPLPYQLTPMGRKPVTITTSAPAPAPLAPPKEETITTTAASTPAAKPAPAPADNNAALMAVSPFLQWVKSNPQAAAAQARQQANGYRPAPNGEPGAPVGAPGADEDPYWLPPLIDSSTFSTSTSPGGSAAIYSTPQR